MYCRKCGSPNEDNAYKCIKCEEILQQAGGGVIQQKIPNYLVHSIIVTVLCCLPLGIPAIIFAAQVNGKIQAGDIQGAMESSRKAKMWVWWSFGTGFVFQSIYLIFTVLTAFANAR